MKLNFLVATTQLNCEESRSFGTGNVKSLLHLAKFIHECHVTADLYTLPFGCRQPNIASPFSLNNGFALTTDELDLFQIPELKQNPDLETSLQQIQKTYGDLFSGNRTVSYSLKRSLTPWVIDGCYQVFKTSPSHQRLMDFREFERLAAYWLNDYALYEVLREIEADLSDPRYRDKNSRIVADVIASHSDRMSYLKYVQFLCFEQRLNIHQELKKIDIGLIVTLPFGVVFDSADVYFHPEVFEKGVEVGCSPEPEHGYPEQKWGVAVYKEQSPGLERYLSEKMAWLSLMGDGVFFDHLVGWCGQYVVPLEIPPDSTYPHGHFLTEDHRERMSNLAWFINVVKTSGLEIKGEVAGDAARVKATSEVIETSIDAGDNISAMVIPRWHSRQNKLIPLRNYPESTLMMVETHDTSTLLQYLLNRKGYDDDFETADRILEFCHRVLALPFFGDDVPLKRSACHESFWFEIARRLCMGTCSHDVIFTLTGFISLLSATYRSATIENNINVKPGTSGKVGNGWRNWSYFSPSIEVLAKDPQLKDALTKLGKREYKPFHPFRQFSATSGNREDLEIIYAKPENRSVIYCNRQEVWTVLSLPLQLPVERIDLELIIRNRSDKELWDRLDVSRILDLESYGQFHFQDLNANRECYSYSSEHLSSQQLFVKLQPGQIHHFLIYGDGDQRLVFEFEDR